MSAVESLREAMPEAARDIKLNLQSVLQPGSLTAEQRWGVAVASAAATHHRVLRNAFISDARAEISEAVIDDALAAAALMAMNNIYYRFRHMVGKTGYSERSPRLRMNRIAKPAASKIDFELFCLAVSAINGCEACIRSHEQTVIDAGLSEDQVHDAIRIAATVHAAAVAVEISDLGIPAA